jgi:SAM-dependent methyltransferase
MDFAAGAVAFAKENFPDVPFYIGDLNKIPVPDNTYSAIICLGVVEHFEEGPDRILAELRRVLAPEGVLHISVPYESLSFRLMNAIEGKNGFDKPKGPFYQYRFRKMEFKQALSKAGFSIGKVSYYGGIIGLKRRARFLKRLLFNRKKSHLENSVSSNARNGHQVSIFKTLKLRMLYPLVWFIETQLTFFAHMILITATPNKNHPPE